MMEANWANTKGYFEPQDLADLHDDILVSVGSAWSDWREFPAAWFGSVDSAVWQRRLGEVFTDNYADADLAVFKEPRICRILPLWDGVFSDLGARPVFCFIDREPLEVAASLRARDGSSLTEGLLYYIRNHLDAEFATRHRSRAFVSYNALLTDWPKTISFISKKLKVSFTISAAQKSQVDTFLERDLRHQNSCAVHYASDRISLMASDVHGAFTLLSMDHSERKARSQLNKLRTIFNSWSEAGYIYGNSVSVNELSIAL